MELIKILVFNNTRILGQYYLLAWYSAVLFSLVIVPGQAAASCEPWAGRALSVQGAVELNRAGETAWSAVKLQDVFCPGEDNICV
ncbi:hypothetical protein MNBD_GAMMA13-925 [hydrothermal vent metagenome]|uniref:Uncharacterized protein n=1 Tax=hydrothermal vent metagenome TaxID=652676 RepID=A0A3B0Z3G9_9ZZZZ